MSSCIIINQLHLCFEKGVDSFISTRNIQVSVNPLYEYIYSVRATPGNEDDLDTSRILQGLANLYSPYLTDPIRGKPENTFPFGGKNGWRP